MIEVPDSAFAPLTDRSKPLHCFDHEEYQYRVKVQAFSSTPPEITIQGISFERDQLAYRRAYENGAEHCFRRSGGLRVPAEGGPSDEDMERARRRAKTRVRKLVKELVPNHFTTFTIRESGPVYYTAEDWKLIWGALCALFASGRSGLSVRVSPRASSHEPGSPAYACCLAW